MNHLLIFLRYMLLMALRNLFLQWVETQENRSNYSFYRCLLFKIYATHFQKHVSIPLIKVCMVHGYIYAWFMSVHVYLKVDQVTSQS